MVDFVDVCFNSVVLIGFSFIFNFIGLLDYVCWLLVFVILLLCLTMGCCLGLVDLSLGVGLLGCLLVNTLVVELVFCLGLLACGCLLAFTCLLFSCLFFVCVLLIVTMIVCYCVNCGCLVVLERLLCLWLVVIFVLFVVLCLLLFISFGWILIGLLQ